MSDEILPDKGQSKLVNLCGLWKRTSLSGNPYLRGRLGNATVLIMPNGFKTQDNQPDLIMYLAPPPPRDDKQANNADVAVEQAVQGNVPPAATGGADDDIPF